MDIHEAKKIVGNQPKWAIKNMVKALSTHSWLNTEAEKRRLQAGKIILKKVKK
jgi:hypothetical protein